MCRVVYRWVLCNIWRLREGVCEGGAICGHFARPISRPLSASREEDSATSLVRSGAPAIAAWSVLLGQREWVSGPRPMWNASSNCGDGLWSCMMGLPGGCRSLDAGGEVSSSSVGLETKTRKLVRLSSYPPPLPPHVSAASFDAWNQWFWAPWGLDPRTFWGTWGEEKISNFPLKCTCFFCRNEELEPKRWGVGFSG